jgi:hypothetical protein
MPVFQIFNRFVEFIVGTIFIDCIICQVHTQILKIALIRLLILLRRQSYQSFPIYKNA